MGNKAHPSAMHLTYATTALRRLSLTTCAPFRPVATTDGVKEAAYVLDLPVA